MERELFVDCRLAEGPAKLFCEALGLCAWNLVDLRTGEPIEELPFFASKDSLRDRLESLVNGQLISAEEMERNLIEVMVNPEQYPGLADNLDTVLALAYEKGATSVEPVEDFDVKAVTYGRLKGGQFTIKDEPIMEGFSTREVLFDTILTMVKKEYCTPAQALRLYYKALVEFGDLPGKKKDLYKILIPKQDVFWIRTHNRPIFEKAGVVYGILVLEDGETAPVNCTNDAMEVLNSFKENDVITEEVFERVVEQIRASGMDVNMLPIIEKIVNLEIPAEAYEDWYRFVLCKCHSDLPHGCMKRCGEHMENNDKHIESLLQTIELEMESGIMLTNHAVAIIQHGYRVGMCFTQAELDEAYQNTYQSPIEGPDESIDFCTDEDDE